MATEKKPASAKEPKAKKTPVKKAPAKKTTAKKPAAKKTATKSSDTALAVVKKTPSLDVTQLFSSLDVAALNQAVEDIANRDPSQKFSNKEKNFALSIIDEWERGVVNQIRDEHDKVTTFVSLVKNFSREYKSLIDNPDYIEPLRQLIAVAGLDDKLMIIKDAIDAVHFAEEEVTILDKNGIDDDITNTDLEKLTMLHNLEKDRLVKQNAVNKAKRTLNRIVSEFGLELNKNEDVKAALNKLTSFSRALTKSKNECASKANSAKLAISIDDPALRTKLKALISISLI